MLVELPYDRNSAIEYAKTWAFKRNPAFLNFDKLGGDCTNYASQCIYAGSKVMNYTKIFGWYYRSSDDRTPAWSGVQYLFNFLTSNDDAGPYAQQVGIDEVEKGDIIQLGNEEINFYHSPVIVDVSDDDIFVAAHSIDSYMRSLKSYEYKNIRFLHIMGVRTNE